MSHLGSHSLVEISIQGPSSWVFAVDSRLHRAVSGFHLLSCQPQSEAEWSFPQHMTNHSYPKMEDGMKQ